MKTLFEKALIAWLAMDPESSSRLKKLSGKVVGIELQGMAVHCQMIFQENQLMLRWHDFLPEDLSIRGTPLRLLQLKLSRERQRFFSEDVSVVGDMTLAREVMAIFDELQPDWEEWASHWMGDAMAFRAGEFLRRACRATRDVGLRLTNHLSNYIQEELSLCPPREALQDFYDDVDAFRLQLDRLEASVSMLRGKS